MRWGLGILLVLLLAVPARGAEGVDLRGATPAARGLADTAEVRALGDVNGDGLADLAIGTNEERAAGRRCEPLDGPVDEDDARAWQPVAHVVLGRLGRRAFELDGLVRLACPSAPTAEDEGPPGSGISYGTSVGGTVGAAGDWNGDGLADMAVGAISAAPRGRPNAGSAYIAFGAKDLLDRDLRDASSVVRIDGPQRASALGESIVPVGDVDGDGRPDLALPHRVGVAAGDGRRLGRERVRIAVVFGGAPAGTRIDLAAPGRDAIVLTGFPQGRIEPAEPSVAPAGDLDGDGRGDLLVGLPGGDVSREFGSAIVVRGRPGPALVDVSRETALLRIKGAPGDALGATVALLGDVTGDGRPELAIGDAFPPGTLSLPAPRGSVVVVPPRTGVVDLARPPADVRRVLGPREASDFGQALQAAGDLTGDGRPDLVAGAPRTTPDCRHSAGAIFVIPGAPAGGRASVEALPGAWRIDGARPLAQLGRDIAVADLDADGVAEILGGALPFGNAASKDLYAVAATAPRVALPAVEEDGCLSARAAAPRLSAVRRTGAVTVTVRSSMGRGVPHDVRVVVRAVPVRGRPSRAVEDEVFRGLFPEQRGGRLVRFTGPSTRRVTVRLSRKDRRRLAGARGAYLTVSAEQTLSAPRTGPEGTGALDGRILRLGNVPRLEG